MRFTRSFLGLFSILLISACASSPQTMRAKEPYYQTELNRPIVSAIECVSGGIDSLDVGIFEPISQSVKYLPNSTVGTIYLSFGKAPNAAIIDFTRKTKTTVKLFYNTNVIVTSDKLKNIIDACHSV